MTVEEISYENEFYHEDYQVKLAAQVALEAIKEAITIPEVNYKVTIPGINDKEEEEEEKPKVVAQEENDNDDLIYQWRNGRFICPREGCNKLYKNRNGLKYHLCKGVCAGSYDVIGPDGNLVNPNNISPSQPRTTALKAIDFQNDPEAYARYKPFWCKLCSKRYKNVNGLKYHGRVEHAKYSFETHIKGYVDE